MSTWLRASIAGIGAAALLSCARQAANPSDETPTSDPDARSGDKPAVDAPVEDAAAVTDAKKYANQRPRPDTYVTHDFGTFQTPPCDPTKAVLCEDFESGVMNPKWQTTFNRIVVDTTRARSGKYALHAKASKDAAGGASITISDIFPMPKNKFNLRVFLYIAGPPPVYNYNLFSVSGRAKEVNEDRMFILSGVTDPWGDPNGRRVTVLGGPDHSGKVGPAPISFDRWSCWEWQVDGTTNEWRVWVEEELHLLLTPKNIDNRWVVPDLARMSIELQQKDEPAPIEVWFDDMVVSQDRVGCGSL